MASGPSDLVADTKIRVEFDSDLTYRFTIQSGISLRRRERKETWILDRKLGQGNYGSVWLHRSQTNNQDEVQAVKRIDKAKMLRERVDWHKELEAIAKFSQKKVCLLAGELHAVIFADLNSMPVCSSISWAGMRATTLSSLLWSTSSMAISTPISQDRCPRRKHERLPTR